MLTSIHLPPLPWSMAGGALEEPGLVTGWFMGRGVGVGAPLSAGLLVLSPCRISSDWPGTIMFGSLRLLRATIASTVVLYWAAIVKSRSPDFTWYFTTPPAPAAGTTFSLSGGGAGAETRVGVLPATGAMVGVGFAFTGLAVGAACTGGLGALSAGWGAGAALPGMVNTWPEKSRLRFERLLAWA